MAKDKGEKKEEKEKTPLTPEEEAAKAKKKKLIIFGAIGLLVLLGGGGGAFFFLSKGGKPADAQPPATSEAHPEDAHAEKVTEGGDGHAEGKKEADGKSDGKEAKADKKEGEKAGEHGGDAATSEDGKKEGEKGGEHKSADKKGDDEKPEYKGDFGMIKEFKPFHLNLGNPLENRYVRVSIGVEYKSGPEQLLELDRREPQLRDLIVTIISRKTREHLLSPDGKDQLRMEIRNRLNQYLDMKIENVFITDILIE